MVNYVLNLTPFASILFYIYMCGTKSVMGIRFVSTKLLNTDLDKKKIVKQKLIRMFF